MSRTKIILLIISLVIVGVLFSIATASATHNGPIEFGKERAERATICFTKEAAFTVVQAELQLIKDGDLGKLQSIFKTLTVQNKCVQKEIRYTPIRTVCQYPGKAITPKGKIYDSVTSILSVKNTNGNIEYVFVPDEAPAPDGRFDICKAAGIY